MGQARPHCAVRPVPSRACHKSKDASQQHGQHRRCPPACLRQQVASGSVLLGRLAWGRTWPGRHTAPGLRAGTCHKALAQVLEPSPGGVCSPDLLGRGSAAEGTSCFTGNRCRSPGEQARGVGRGAEGHTAGGGWGPPARFPSEAPATQSPEALEGCCPGSPGTEPQPHPVPEYWGVPGPQGQLRQGGRHGEAVVLVGAPGKSREPPPPGGQDCTVSQGQVTRPRPRPVTCWTRSAALLPPAASCLPRAHFCASQAICALLTDGFHHVFKHSRAFTGSLPSWHFIGAAAGSTRPGASRCPSPVTPSEPPCCRFLTRRGPLSLNVSRAIASGVLGITSPSSRGMPPCHPASHVLVSQARDQCALLGSSSSFSGFRDSLSGAELGGQQPGQTGLRRCVRAAVWQGSRAAAGSVHRTGCGLARAGQALARERVTRTRCAPELLQC